MKRPPRSVARSAKNVGCIVRRDASILLSISTSLSRGLATETISTWLSVRLWGSQSLVPFGGECGVSVTESPPRFRHAWLLFAMACAQLTCHESLHDINILDEIAVQDRCVSLIDTKQRTHPIRATSLHFAHSVCIFKKAGALEPVRPIIVRPSGFRYTRHRILTRALLSSVAVQR